MGGMKRRAATGLALGLTLLIGGGSAHALQTDRPTAMKLDQTYHKGRFAFLYDGFSLGLKTGQRLQVLRKNKPVGTFEISSVTPGITRGTLLPGGKITSLKTSDHLKLLSGPQANAPAPPSKDPPIHMVSNPVFGMSLFEMQPYEEVGASLEATLAMAPEVVAQGNFVMDANTATKAINITPRKGYTLSYTQHQSTVESSLGGSIKEGYTVAGLQTTLNRPAAYISRKVFPSLGAFYIATGTDQDQLKEERFAGYGILRYSDKRAETWFGLGSIGGPGYGKSSFSLLMGFSRPFIGKSRLTVGYASKDYHKDTYYNLKLPLEAARLGLGQPLICQGCKKDALSFALDYRLGKAKSFRLGMFDVLDLQSPIFSLKGEF